MSSTRVRLFETAKRSAAPAAMAKPAAKALPVPAGIKLELGSEPEDAGFTIEAGGPVQTGAGGLRIPLIVRAASGRRQRLTLALCFESEDA